MSRSSLPLLARCLDSGKAGPGAGSWLATRFSFFLFSPTGAHKSLTEPPQNIPRTSPNRPQTGPSPTPNRPQPWAFSPFVTLVCSIYMDYKIYMMTPACDPKQRQGECEREKHRCTTLALSDCLAMRSQVGSVRTLRWKFTEGVNKHRTRRPPRSLWAYFSLYFPTIPHKTAT